MIRQGHLLAVVWAFLIAVVVVGCANARGNIDDKRGGEEDAHATNAEITAPKGDRSAAGTAQEEFVGFDEEVVSPPGQANLPAGFGEGSLWATDFDLSGGCDDVTGGGSSSVSSSATASAPACSHTAPPKPLLLKRVDPRSGEVVAEIPLEGLSDVSTQVAFGAGSVWVSHGEVSHGAASYYSSDPKPARSPGDVVLRIDPQTNRIVDRIPVDSPTGLDFGFGSVWVTSGSYGTLSRIDPKTGEVVAKIDVGRGAWDVAVDESSGAVWVATNKLTRVDPETNRVVAEIPIGAGVENVAVGEGAVWVSSSDDARLLKVDPETNEVAGMVSFGAYNVQPVVYGGGVWAVGQGDIEYWLVRVDPTTMHVVAAEDIGRSRIAPGLVAGGGYVWFSSREGLARVSATSWQEQTTEQARCEGTRTILMKWRGEAGNVEADLVTTNDIPGCPNGGLLSGTDKVDGLGGKDGDDEIHGLGGQDTIHGGEGNDIIYGGPGNDRGVTGDDGDDVIYGGDAHDDLDGGGGDDVLYGGDGDDNLSGGAGPGEDVIYGGDGSDALYDDEGQRTKFYCGAGRDFYDADKNDYVDSSCEIKGGRLVY